MGRRPVPKLPDTPIPNGLGIYKNVRNTRYIVNVRLNGERISLGSFEKLEDAVTAAETARSDIVAKRTVRYSTKPIPRQPLSQLKGTPFYGL